MKDTNMFLKRTVFRNKKIIRLEQIKNINKIMLISGIGKIEFLKTSTFPEPANKIKSVETKNKI